MISIVSGLFVELMLAFSAGHMYLAGAALEPEDRVALGAFEILVFFPVFKAKKRLPCFGFYPVIEAHHLLIFTRPARPITGKHPIDDNAIQDQRDRG
ncbi:MAG: hypothetical protein IJ240_00655 [Clostridia bacterium]|nr:hypothetical protein [Clostridia bacterium]